MSIAPVVNKDFLEPLVTGLQPQGVTKTILNPAIDGGKSVVDMVINEPDGKAYASRVLLTINDSQTRSTVDIEVNPASLRTRCDFITFVLSASADQVVNLIITDDTTTTTTLKFSVAANVPLLFDLKQMEDVYHVFGATPATT